MDFQTMLKRVKARSYKSKREFKDDLDLIWSNCLLYNAAPVRHSNDARPISHSSFHADPTGAPPTTMRETPSTES